MVSVCGATDWLFAHTGPKSILVGLVATFSVSAWPLIGTGMLLPLNVTSTAPRLPLSCAVGVQSSITCASLALLIVVVNGLPGFILTPAAAAVPDSVNVMFID